MIYESQWLSVRKDGLKRKKNDWLIDWVIDDMKRLGVRHEGLEKEKKYWLIDWVMDDIQRLGVRHEGLEKEKKILIDWLMTFRDWVYDMKDLKREKKQIVSPTYPG